MDAFSGAAQILIGMACVMFQITAHDLEIPTNWIPMPTASVMCVIYVLTMETTT